MTSKEAPIPLSVVMAVRNGLPYLRDAVQSILDQSFSEFEFLIIDDGSDDGTREELARLQRSDERIEVFHIEHAGVAAAMNKGMERARGKYIARMDADDISFPNRFERQIEVLESDPGLVIVGSQVELMTSDGIRIGVKKLPLDHKAIRSHLLRGNAAAMSHPAVMMRRDVAQKVGFYDKDFLVGEDLDIFLKLSEIGETANLSEPLLCWRQHGGSLNRTKNSLWRDVNTRAVTNAIERVGPQKYATDLLATLEPNLPLDRADVWANVACRNGRYSAAIKLSLRHLRNGPERAKALIPILKVFEAFAKSLVRGRV